MWLALFFAITLGLAAADPPKDRLTYSIEWRLIHAGEAVLEYGPSSASVKLESAGLVSTLYKVQDAYRVEFDTPFCATSSMMNSSEGSRRRETAVTFDRNRGRASLTERDLIKNSVVSKTEVQIPNCVQEVAAALLRLRRTKVEVGQSTQIPMSDGRKSTPVKVDAQERERIKTPAGTFNTVRYEANLLNGVIYTRKGRAFIWLTDDDRRVPVRILLRMNFPLGTVTLDLEKEEHP